MSNQVVKKMAEIQELFMEVQRYRYITGQFDKVIIFLNSKPPEFRSVGYESASFSIALDDLKNERLTHWFSFEEASSVHRHHVAVGLGWAFAKLGANPRLYPPIEPILWMVLDGMGYYFALYHARRTVKRMVVPEFVEPDLLRAFDQGLGRRLWYISQGEPRRADELINHFVAGRRKDLWRGLGIACGYVGGTDQERLADLKLLAGKNHLDLAAGLAMAAHARSSSAGLTADIGMAITAITGLSIEELEAMTKNLYSGSVESSLKFYINLIKQMEEHFVQVG